MQRYRKIPSGEGVSTFFNINVFNRGKVLQRKHISSCDFPGCVCGGGGILDLLPPLYPHNILVTRSDTMDRKTRMNTKLCVTKQRQTQNSQKQ